jgi:PhnB protein
MARVSTYLNFMGKTEEAFDTYKKVFGTDYNGPLYRMGDMPAEPNTPPLSDAEKHMIMHVELPILAGHMIMGTDMIESAGHELRLGNTMTINLEPDTRAETERLFAALSDGGSEVFALQDMPWGSYWGTCLDRFGTRWMFNCTEASAAA